MNNPPTRQAWILEQLTERPTLSYVDGLAEYGQKWAKSKTTFDKDWNKAKEQHLALQQKINAAKEAAIIREEARAAKNGLKSKLDRLLALQTEWEAISSELKRGVTKETKMVGGKAASFERDLTVLEKTQLRKSLKDLSGEISKIEGDYAPTKAENKVTVDTAVDLSGIPDIDLDALERVITSVAPTDGS